MNAYQNSNCCCFFDPDDQTNSMMIFVKDREKKDEERWVAVFLEEDEAKELYEYLKEHFTKDRG